MHHPDLKVNEGAYIPPQVIDYPQEDPYAHLVKVEKSAGSADTYAFDETYPYLDDSFRFKLNSWVNALAKWLLVSPWNWIKYGLRIKGKEVLKPYKEQLKGGTVCLLSERKTRLESEAAPRTVSRLQRYPRLPCGRLPLGGIGVARPGLR